MRVRATVLAFLLVAGIAVSSGPGVSASTPPVAEAAATSTAAGTTGGFTPVTPTRFLDTRASKGGRGYGLRAGEVLTLKVVGKGGVPTSGVSAVALNVTAVAPTSVGYLTLWPADTSRPLASTLNFVKGQVVPNAAVIPVSPDGSIKIYNPYGSTHTIVDVNGWFATSPTVGMRNVSDVPSWRAYDSRQDPDGPLVAGQNIWFDFCDIATDGALALNITVTKPTASSHLTVFPHGAGTPTASNLNFVRGQTVANMVHVGTGVDCGIEFEVGSGSTHVVMDVLAWWDGNDGPANSRYHAVHPTRILDTRTAKGGSGPLGAKGVHTVQITGGDLPVPDHAAAVVFNLTATNVDGDNYLTVWPSDLDRPLASNLNVKKGDTRANLVVSALSADGAINIYDAGGGIDIIVDVIGWYDRPVYWLPAAPTTPTTAPFADVVIDDAGERVFVNQPGYGAIDVTRLDDLSLEGAASTPDDAVYGLDVSPDGNTVLTTQSTGPDVIRLDWRTDEVIESWDLPDGTAVATDVFELDGDQLFVATDNDKFFRIDLTTDTVGELTVPYDSSLPSRPMVDAVIERSADRTMIAIASSSTTAKMMTWNATTQSFQLAPGDGPAAQGLDPGTAGSTIALSGGLLYSGSTLAPLGAQNRACLGIDVGVDEARHRMYVTKYEGGEHDHVRVCDSSSGTPALLDSIFVFGRVHAGSEVAVSPDGRTVVARVEEGITIIRTGV